MCSYFPVNLLLCHTGDTAETMSLRLYPALRRIQRRRYLPPIDRLLQPISQAIERRPTSSAQEPTIATNKHLIPGTVWNSTKLDQLGSPQNLPGGFHQLTHRHRYPRGNIENTAGALFY